jgi:hypothetical protein
VLGMFLQAKTAAAQLLACQIGPAGGHICQRH